MKKALLFFILGVAVSSIPNVIVLAADINPTTYNESKIFSNQHLENIKTENMVKTHISSLKRINNGEKIFYKYTNTYLNFREYPSLDSKIYYTFPINKKIKVIKYNNEWYKAIDDGGKVGYVYKKYTSDNKRVNYKDYSAAVNTTKSFMPYTAITSAESPQYRLQQKAYTGSYGIRQVDGRYCVALGSYYTTAVGTYFDLILENGTVIPCILADCKADRHTDETNRVTFDGSLAEFVVDGKALEKRIWKSGDVSSADASWDSPVKTVRIYERKIKL